MIAPIRRQADPDVRGTQARALPAGRRRPARGGCHTETCR